MPSFLRLATAISLLLSTSFFGGTLSADQTSDRPLLRAVYGDFFPYSFTGPDGTAQGYNVDVTRQLAATAGYDVQFVHAENPRQFLEMLAQGEIELTPFLALTPERQTAGLATTPLGAYEQSVHVRADSKITDLTALSDKRIGVVLGSANKRAAEVLPDVEVVEYTNSEGLILPLLGGEIDAVIVVTETFEERLRKSFIEDKARRLEPPLAVSPYGIIVRRDLVEVHAALQAVIDREATDAILKKIRARWFGNDRSIVEHPWFSNVAMIIGGIALTTFALGIYAFRLRRRSLLLATESSANQLLIDAFDQMRAAITIFDAEMKAVYWNSGFVARFPEIVPRLKTGATLAQICVDFYRTGRTVGVVNPLEADEFAEAMAQKLVGGMSDQRIVHTAQGSSFDLSMFPLGARYYAAIWVDVTELQQQQKQVADQSTELVRKNQQLLAFSAMAAHDLKAPLMQQKMLVGFITEDLLEAEISLPAEAWDNLAILGDLSGRMSLLVSDLLDYAKADSDQAPLDVLHPMCGSRIS